MTSYIVDSWEGIRFKLSTLKKRNLIIKWKFLLLGRKLYYGGMTTLLLSLFFISSENCELVLKIDTGITGWSAVLRNIFVKGFFSSEECNCNINLFELKAVYFGLRVLCRYIRKTHVKILTDNTTAIQHSINKFDSCRSIKCDNEMRKIRE